MEVMVQLKGFNELAEALKQLPDNIAKNALKSAVAAGGRIVRDEAKSRIGGGGPSNITGTLKRSLYVKFIRELSAPHRAVYFVGARQAYNYNTRAGSKKVKEYGKFDAYYARWVEFGHFSRPAGKQLKRGRGRTAAIQTMLATGQVHWIQGKPFLRPAFEASKGRAIDAMSAKLRERLERFRVQGK